MENWFNFRLPWMFHSPFFSCRSKNISDTTGKPVFLPHHQNNRNFHENEPISPKSLPILSICTPDLSETTETIVSDSIIPRREVSERYSPFTRPPASPISPKFEENKQTQMKKTKKKKTQMKKKERETMNYFCSLSSSTMESNLGGTWYYSSEDEDHEREDDTDTLFSSRSFSSNSSDSRRRRSSRRRRRTAKRSCENGAVPLRSEKVENSFAVVKKSSDPYDDFRTSMLEMIVEKQIFSGKDLEELLQCFLSLNSKRYHGVIVEVFMEISEAVFADWGS